MSFVERFIIQCPYFGGSTIGGSTVLFKARHLTLSGFVFCRFIGVPEQALEWSPPRFGIT